MFFSLTFIFPESPYYQQKHHNPPALERLQLWTQLRRFLTLGGGEAEERGSNRHSPQSTRSERLGKETLDVSVTEHSLQKALIVDQKRERVKMEATGQPPDSTRACTLPFKGLRVDSFLLSIQKYQSSNYECQPLLCF